MSTDVGGGIVWVLDLLTLRLLAEPSKHSLRTDTAVAEEIYSERRYSGDRPGGEKQGKENEEKKW